MKVLILVLAIGFAYYRSKIAHLTKILKGKGVFWKISEANPKLKPQYIKGFWITKNAFLWEFLVYHCLIYFCFSL